MAIYHRDRKLVANLSIVLESEREKLDCAVFEKWEDIDCSTTARCGAEGTCEVKKTEGISERSISTLKSTIESGFGVEGLISLKSKIEEALGHEVNWSQSIETTKTFPYKAPKCGRYTLTIYQLVREYELTYWRKQRWPHRPTWDKKSFRLVKEHTNTHDALPDVEEYDEVCNCQEPTQEAELKYDGRLCFDLGTISFRVPYRLTPSGFDAQITRHIVAFSFADPLAATRELDSGVFVDLPQGIIPEPLLFLAGRPDTFPRFPARVLRIQGPVSQPMVASPAPQSIKVTQFEDSSSLSSSGEAISEA